MALLKNTLNSYCYGSNYQIAKYSMREPDFTNTRVPVKNLFVYLKGGYSSEDFLEDFPSAKKEQAVQVIEHFENLLNFHSWPMEKILLYENLTVQLKYRLQDVCGISTVEDKGWNTLENGNLLNVMQENGFDYLITSDKNLQHREACATTRLKIIEYSNRYSYRSLILKRS